MTPALDWPLYEHVMAAAVAAIIMVRDGETTHRARAEEPPDTPCDTCRGLGYVDGQRDPRLSVKPVPCPDCDGWGTT